jgi:3-hydroxyisobutyrate dehydrogenase
MEIGLCGLGRMGAAMAARLLDEGHRLTLWNRSPEKAQPLLERGARWAETPAAVAGGADLVITVLIDDGAVRAVYEGPQGLFSGEAAGKLFIDMSTVLPRTVMALAENAKAKGAAMLDCPVSGSVGPAREGKLIGLVGGDAADLARARPILEHLCRRIDHLGSNGAGAVAKLAVNLPLAVYWETLGEALALTRDAGIDPAQMIEIMRESSGGTNALRGPRGDRIAAAIKAGAVTPEVGFTIDGGRKDLKLMVEAAREMGFAVPVAAEAMRCYDGASRDGWSANDQSSLAVYRVLQAKGTPR